MIICADMQQNLSKYVLHKMRDIYIYPRTGDIVFSLSVCPSVCPSVYPSETLCVEFCAANSS